MIEPEITIDWLASYGVDLPVAQAYAQSLRAHIYYVQLAGKKLGVPDTLLNAHDHSKWDAEEFPAYARHFKGGGDPDGFLRAWLHHLHHNPHHPEHWEFPAGSVRVIAALPNADVEDGMLEMPQEYVLEMVADWIGASLAYTGSEDMAGWLTGNIPKIRVHTRTAATLRQVLGGLGYGDLLSKLLFAHEMEPSP